MPNGFDDQAIRDVAAQLVRSVIRRPHDTLGVRRTDVTFTDVRETSASIFLLNPKAPYAVAELARVALQTDLAQVAEITASMTQALEAIRRKVVPVKDLSSLSNAQAALTELEGAVRSTPPRDVTALPSYVRFDKNLRRFLDKAGSNVRSKGTVVPTPNEARSLLRAKTVELEALLTALLARALLLAAALEDYAKVGLPQLVAGNVVASARTMLDARVTDLEKRSESGRLDVLKDTVLELLAMRGVVKAFGSFTPPSTAYSLSGAGSLFSDASRKLERATLEAYKSGPYALVPGTTLDNSRSALKAWLDGANPAGAPSVTLFLPSSVVPMLQGTASGPFTIVAGTNDELRVVVGGVTYVSTLSDGVLSAADVAALLTADLFGSGFKAEAYFAPLYFDGEAVVSGNVLTPVLGTFPAQSVDVGYEVDFYLGPNAGVTRTVTAVGGSLSAPASITVSGGALTAGPNQRIRYGTSARKVRIVPTNPLSAVQTRVRIDLAPLTAAQKQTGITLGLFGTLFAQGKPTDASVIAEYINQAQTSLQAEAFLRSPLLRSVRTDPLNGTKLVAYDLRSNASWAAGSSAVLLSFTDVLSAAVSVGTKIVLREGMNPNAVGTVVARLSDTELSVDFLSPVQAGSGLVEGGRPVAVDSLIRIESGPLAGDYHVDAVSSSLPFEVTLREFLTPFRTTSAEPVFASALVGSQGLRFQSKTEALSASVEVVDPLLVFFNAPQTNKALPKTRYVKLPEAVSALEEGDRLELYASNFENPDQAFQVTQVFGDQVIELSGLLSVPQPLNFGSSALPFARLRVANAQDFQDLSDAVREWARPWEGRGLPRFFINFTGKLNPVLVNENPTAVQVGEVGQLLAELEDAFGPGLSAALSVYRGPTVDEVTALFQALREKGADRAVDVLLACRFQDYFGLNQEGVSYSGALQSAIRDVAQMDLPVRKGNRAQSTASQLVGSAESTDFEYSTEDLDETLLPDPTIDFS
jgi:hypothetical protein